MKKHPILAAALTLCLTLSLLCAGAEAASSNVQQEALQILGIFTGEENPAGVVTRAQFAQPPPPSRTRRRAAKAPCFRT